MASSQRDDTFRVGGQERARTNEQSTSSAVYERCKGRLDVAVATDIENDELLPDGLRRSLRVASLRREVRAVRIQEHGNCRRLGHKLP
jgi:hypothetical protein